MANYFEEQEKKQWSRKQNAIKSTTQFMKYNNLAREAKLEDWDDFLAKVVMNLENIREQAKGGMGGFFWDQLNLPYAPSEPIRCKDYVNAWFDEFCFDYAKPISFTTDQINYMKTKINKKQGVTK